MNQEPIAKVRRRGKERKPLPSLGFLIECFTHDRPNGVLIWNTRPVSHFPSEEAAKNWNRRFAGTEAGSKCCRPNGARRHRDVGLKLAADGKAYLYSVHLIIWLMLGREIPENYEIDHRDRDPWNNHEDNLRLATPADNVRNRIAQLGKKSKLPKCVFRDRQYFRVQIKIGSEVVFCKNYKTEEEAILVAKEKLGEHHKDFANM